MGSLCNIIPRWKAREQVREREGGQPRPVIGTSSHNNTIASLVSIISVLLQWRLNFHRGCGRDIPNRTCALGAELSSPPAPPLCLWLPCMRSPPSITPATALMRPCSLRHHLTFLLAQLFVRLYFPKSEINKWATNPF